MQRIAAIVVLLGLAAAGQAIINPRFTPKDLVEQSDVVLAGPVRAAGGQWKLTASVVLKGKAAKLQLLDLAACRKDDAASVDRALKAQGTAAVILFAGTYDQQKRAYLCAGGLWLAMEAGGKDRWSVVGLAPQMSGTYAGGGDMLIRMSEYLIKDPDASVPVSAGVRWIGHTSLGRVKGELAGLAAVDLARGGKVHLFVAAAGGDRLYRPKDEEALQEVTAEVALRSRSRRFVWMDANGDGLADLVTWDGSNLSLHLGGKDGAFKPAGPAWTRGLKGECLALAACARAGRPGVLVSTRGLPLLLTADPKAGWKEAPLPAGEDRSLAGHLGRVSACLVADLDGDGFADVLQPGQAAGRLWKGSPAGFARPVASPVRAGGGTARAAFGDFDGDGALDVFLAGPQGNGLWENDGKGGFREVLRRSGSMSYKCPPAAADVRAADLNHDGRQDLCFAYAGGDLLYHWNRGYRCFAEEGEVRLPGAVPADAGAERIGQRALAVGDFNADGSEDLAVVLTTGEVQVYFNDQMDMPGLRLRLGKGLAGPVTASCWTGDAFKVCLGAAVVTGHVPSAYLSARQPGPCTIRYRLGGSPARTRKITVEDGAAEVILDGAEAGAKTADSKPAGP